MVPSNPGITLPVIVDVDNHGNNPQGRGFPSTDCKPRHNCCHPRIAQTVPATLRLHSKPGTPTAGDPGSACSDKVTDPDEFGNDEMAAVEKLAACCRHLQGQHQDHRVAEEGIVAGNSETSCHGSPPAKPAVTTIDACEMKPGSSAITLTASLNHSTPHCHCHCHWPQASRPQSKTKGQGSSTVPVPDFLRVQSDRRTGQPTITITGTTAKFTNISPLTSASSVLQSPSPYIPVFLASLGHGPSQTIVHKSAHGQASVLTPEGQNTPRDFAAFTNPPASEQPPPPPPPQPRLSFSTATNPHSQLFTPASTSIHSGILHSRPPSVSTSGTGDDSVLADDALMDELSSAAVLEATSVPVITSPPTSPPIGVFAESPKSPQSPMSPQTLSSGTNGPLAATDPPDSQPLPPVRRPTTSQSNASLHESAANGSGSAAAGLARKVTVSSGISKRIEALKMMSNNNGGGNPAPNRLSPHAHQSPAAMERFRKRASDNYTSRPMTSNSNEPLVHQRRLSFVPAEHLRGGVPAASQRLAPETRAFTLPIPFSPAGREESTNNAASGMRSPIQRPATSAAASAKELDRGSSLTRTPSSASLSVRSPNVDPLTGLRRPETASPATTVATSTSDETTGPATLPQPDRPQSPEQKVQQADEVMSPTPNIMRRVTSMGQGIAIHNRRTSVASIISNFNLPSPTATEPEQPSITPIQQEPEPTPVPAAKPQPAQALEIGEVNVQFPDTLLWKRRDMRVDEEGYLHLTAQPIGTSSFVPAPKKYHMSTFQVPRIPDLDEQELPNSVVLAFVGDVSSLQFACQSRQGQEGLHKGKDSFTISPH
ncbi:hypothetical protein KEM55_007840 [Ascosphaera atra]|nr:hypothetical protein KEM55_007840 [Ascosphaera atra]